MRLREIYYILDKNIDQVAFTLSNNNNGTFVLSGLNAFRTALTEIEKTGIMREEVSQLRSSIIFSSKNDSMHIIQTDGNTLNNLKTKIFNLGKELQKTLADILKPTHGNSIFIKFPPISDFKQLAQVAQTIQTSLEQAILNKEINGEVKIENVENGSIWFEVFVGAPTAVSLIGGMAWSAAVIYKKIQEGKILHQSVESLKIKNESLEDIKDGQTRAIKIMLDSEAELLYSEYFNDESPDKNEQILRLRNTIKTFSELIQDGAEISPALNAPENVSNLYPNYKQIAGLESRIKKIAGTN